MMFRCTNTEVVTLDLLCDGINQCTGGQDEVGFICESKLYSHADSPSETWICTVHMPAACIAIAHNYIHYYYATMHSNYYILQTSAASLTTETAISHENVSLLCLVKTAGAVCLG